jgi:hypothetical protein
MITAHPRAGLYTLNLKRWLLNSISAYKHFILQSQEARQQNKRRGTYRHWKWNISHSICMTDIRSSKWSSFFFTNSWDYNEKNVPQIPWSHLQNSPHLVWQTLKKSLKMKLYIMLLESNWFNYVLYQGKETQETKNLSEMPREKILFIACFQKVSSL